MCSNILSWQHINFSPVFVGQALKLLEFGIALLRGTISADTNSVTERLYYRMYEYARNLPSCFFLV